jgi:hypothetical protein
MSKNISAYPSGESYTTFNNVSGVTTQHGKSPLHTGMTLLDHFAGLAMQGIIHGYSGSYAAAAKVSYEMAYEMLAERNKHHKEKHHKIGGV